MRLFLLRSQVMMISGAGRAILDEFDIEQAPVPEPVLGLLCEINCGGKRD